MSRRPARRVSLRPRTPDRSRVIARLTRILSRSASVLQATTSLKPMHYRTGVRIAGRRNANDFPRRGALLRGRCPRLRDNPIAWQAWRNVSLQQLNADLAVRCISLSSRTRHARHCPRPPAGSMGSLRNIAHCLLLDPSALPPPLHDVLRCSVASNRRYQCALGSGGGHIGSADHHIDLNGSSRTRMAVFPNDGATPGSVERGFKCHVGDHRPSASLTQHLHLRSLK